MAVTALEVKTRQTLANGRDFGSVGRYIRLDGTAHFAVDPAHPLNGCITDIDLAPRGDGGLVHFSADIRILTPENPGRGNHRLSDSGESAKSMTGDMPAQQYWGKRGRD